MDCLKVGAAIKTLRTEKGLKQRQLAERLNISEKTISKWERGLGCPDTNLLTELAEVLQTSVQSILGGNVDIKSPNSGNFKKLTFYICKNCGNLMTSFDEMAVYCCGRKLPTVLPEKAIGEQLLTVEKSELDFFVCSNRTMSKQNYVLFVAYMTSDSLVLKGSILNGTCKHVFFTWGRAGWFGAVAMVLCYIKIFKKGKNMY